MARIECKKVESLAKESEVKNKMNDDDMTPKTDDAEDMDDDAEEKNEDEDKKEEADAE